MKKVVAVIAGGLSLVYILNPTAGFLEFIPDNLPFVGNLDEATAVGVLIWAYKTLTAKSDETIIADQEDLVDSSPHL